MVKLETSIMTTQPHTKLSAAPLNTAKQETSFDHSTLKTFYSATQYGKTRPIMTTQQQTRDFYSVRFQKVNFKKGGHFQTIPSTQDVQNLRYLNAALITGISLNFKQERLLQQ